MINIIEGKDAIWETDNYDVVLIGTTIYNTLSNGFQAKIKSKYPAPSTAAENYGGYGNRNKFGKRLTFEGSKPTLSFLFIAGYPNSRRVFLDYDALENCLATANADFKGQHVMTTMLGCTRFDGNGDRDKVLGIFEETTRDIILDIYDYEQLDKETERKIELQKLRENDYEHYMSMGKNKNEFLKTLYLV